MKAISTTILTLICATLAWSTPLLAQTSNTKKQTNLQGTSWQLVKVHAGRKIVTPDDGSKYTISFGTDGQLSARVDCNRGRGTWKISSANQVSFGPLALTRAMCPPESLHDQMVRDLVIVRSYTIEGGHLFLWLKGKAGAYEFEPMRELVGRRWGLVEVRGVAVNSKNAYIEFDSKTGRVSGNGGCNLFSGEFEINGPGLKLGRLLSTKRACLDGEIQNVENRFLGTLERITNYQVRGDKLVLSANGDSVLTFRAEGKNP